VDYPLLTYGSLVPLHPRHRPSQGGPDLQADGPAKYAPLAMALRARTRGAKFEELGGFTNRKSP